MANACRPAKINVTVLIIVVTVVLLLGAGAVIGRHVRRRIIAGKALAEGQAAFDQEHWQAASKHLIEYLSRYPNDVEVLKKYAQAQMSIHPLEAKNIRAAIGAYRRLLRTRPDDESAHEQLPRLYTHFRNFSELAYIATRRLEHDSNDTKAAIWLAKALMFQREGEEARKTLLPLIERLEKEDEKHPEYVEACTLLSHITARGGSDKARADTLKWLDRAVEYDPISPRALVFRARFYRMSPAAAGQTREAMLAAARSDLTRADELAPTDPLVLLILSEEWKELGELDRASAELKALEDVDSTKVKKYFVDEDDWAVAKFLPAAELAIRREAIAECVALVDATLGALKQRRHRVRVLPYAVRFYVAVDRTGDARRCLDEYSGARALMRSPQKSDDDIAYLQAAVARAEGELYRAIDVLEPAVMPDSSDPRLWKLLAEAYSRTDQPRRAIRALIRYLRLRPRDPKMTLQLAKEYLKLRDWNKAFETARLAEPLDPADIVIRLLRIEASVYIAAERRAVIDQGRLEALSKELIELRRLHPRRVDIRILQAIIAIYQKRPTVAENELKLAVEECSETLRAEMQLVRHYFRTKRMSDAIRVCRAACERHFDLAEPWLALSGLRLAARRSDEARAALQAGRGKVVDRWEKRAITIRLALLELLHGDRQSGVGLLRELTKKDEQEIRARSLVLGLPEVRRDRAAAQRLVDEIREVQGQSGLLWRLHQAELWLSARDWRARQQEITGALQRCINSDPEWSAPALLLVEMHRRLKNLDRAEETCRQALSRNPSATDVADRLVSILEERRRFSDAQKVLDQLQADPRFVSARRIGVALNAGDFTQAIDELKLRTANNDQDANSRILLARLVYWQEKDVEGAFEYLREAEAIAPESMALTSAKVSILKAEGRTKEAREILDAQLRNHKSFAAYVMRAAYLTSIGESELAEKDYIELAALSKDGKGHAILAMFYAESNRLNDAVAALEKGVQAHPEDLSLKRNLMKALLFRKAKGDRQRAAAILASLEKQLPEDPDLMRVRATELLREPTPESTRKAQELLKRVVRLEPTSVSAHLTLIDMAMRRGDYETARDLAIRAQGANPGAANLLLARARAERALKNVGMAGKLARMILKEDPGNADARDLLIEAALGTRDAETLNEGRILLEQAIAKDPKDDRLQLQNARILNALGQAEAATAKLKAYSQTQQGKRSVPVLLALAEFYRVRRDFTESGRLIEQASKLAPQSPAVTRERIVWLGHQNKFDQVVRQIAAYRRVKPQDPDVLATGAHVLASSGSATCHKLAMTLYEDAIAIAPKLTAPRLGLALLAYQTGDADRAEGIYREVLESDPNNVRALNDLAWILAEARRDYKNALELANRGVQLAPENRDLRDTRGVILRALHRFKDARKDFEKHVELTAPDSPNRAKGLLQLGRTCEKDKDFTQAKRHLEEALRIHRKKRVFTPEEQAEIHKFIGIASRQDS